MNSTYLYSTLPSIDLFRLLDLQSSVDKPVTCSLIVVDNYKSAPKYHALSYCWGDTNNTISLFYNGIFFLVIKSLYAALCRLRQKRRYHN